MNMKVQKPIIPFILIIVQTIITVHTFILAAQAPLVKQWDRRFGGTDKDFFTSLQQTNDGGYILGGYSISDISGDKTQDSQGSHSHDYWVVKIDASGNKQWDKRFGGFYDDWLFSLQQTADRGYILGGLSNSGIEGDKTQASWGNDDYWIIKIDALGNKQWDRRFGGTNYEELHSLQQTTDGGYILGGWSSSGIGGDKTEPSRGSSDYWIVKIDSSGNKQWDKRFGGTDHDELTSLQQTTDGGYILGGWSESDSSGDKTQPSRGIYDYWIVKTDALGNIQWDKRFGGTSIEYLRSLQQTTEGGYILAGESHSDATGDKTQSSRGWEDYWIIKIDSLGNIQWDKAFGGSYHEDRTKISQTFDGGYLISGDSESDASGDKSEDNLGDKQIWVVKTDSLGSKQWDKTIFTLGDNIRGYAIQTREGCYAMANNTSGGIGGDKTQPNWDTTFIFLPTHDYWIIRFCDSACAILSVSITSVTTHVTCLGAGDGAAKAVASGGTPPYTFLWSDGQATDSPTDFPAGAHSVTVTDANGCSATTSINIAEGELPCTGIPNNPLNNISLYPNPTTGTVTLKAPGIQGKAVLRLYDVVGKLLMQETAQEELRKGVNISLKEQPGNIFFLSITTEAGARVMKVGKY